MSFFDMNDAEREQYFKDANIKRKANAKIHSKMTFKQIIECKENTGCLIDCSQVILKDASDEELIKFLTINEYFEEHFGTNYETLMSIATSPREIDWSRCSLLCPQGYAVSYYRAAILLRILRGPKVPHHPFAGQDVIVHDVSKKYVDEIYYNGAKSVTMCDEDCGMSEDMFPSSPELIKYLNRYNWAIKITGPYDITIIVI